MRTNMYYCDKCRMQSEVEREYHRPDNWRWFTLRIDQHTNREYHLCPDCAELMDIPIPEPYKNTEMTIQDRLAEVLYELALAAQPQKGDSK